MRVVKASGLVVGRGDVKRGSYAANGDVLGPKTYWRNNVAVSETGLR